MAAYTPIATAIASISSSSVRPFADIPNAIELNNRAIAPLYTAVNTVLADVEKRDLALENSRALRHK